MIELKVDDGILLSRIENRVKETLAAGGTVRADDNAEALTVMDSPPNWSGRRASNTRRRAPAQA